jgi:hypothetical protein
MQYVLQETNSNKGKGMKPKAPWVEKLDVKPEDVDKWIKKIENDAPRLYLFFKGNDFELGEVGADCCNIHLQAADVVKAVITFISVYFAFHVGFPPVYNQFLGFMQYALMGIQYTGKKSLGHIALLHKFDKAIESKMEGKKFKKLCV